MSNENYVENYGSYQLIKRLATGGMAQIYLARQQGPEGFEKLLVVKRILPHLSENADFVRMFLDEARIAARLNHPNIVQIFNLGAQDDSYFIAMEYIHGEDVRRVWKRAEIVGKAIPIALVCRIIMDACAGLDYAHKKADQSGKPLGIVHRDISPQNILVTFEGGVKVVDFGIAKAADQATVTRSGVLKGKYSYMSPEQASGKKLDCRSDIFALGVVLHELLTGQRLFKRSNDIQTLHAVTECEVPLPSSINPRLPADLDALVMKALAREPANRFQEAIHLQMALEDWLIAHQLPSSSAHLAAFMEELYAERLAEERKVGQVLVEELDGPARGIDEEPPPSSSGGARARQSLDGRLPAPLKRLTDRNAPVIGGPEPEPTTAERRARRPSQDGVFRDLLKNATGDASTASADVGFSVSGGPTDPANTRSRTQEPTAASGPRLRPRGTEPGRMEETQVGGLMASEVEESRTFSAGSMDPTAPTSSPARQRGFRLYPAVAILVGSLVAGSVVGYLVLGSSKLTSGGTRSGASLATVQVTSEPAGATVLLDGKAWPAPTPCEMPNVLPGPHVLQVRLGGYQEHREDIVAPSEGLLSIQPIHLEREPSNPSVTEPPKPLADETPKPREASDAGPTPNRKVELTIQAEPEASIFVDGAARGRTPFTLTGEPRATVEIRLERSGYRAVSRKLELGDTAREELIHLVREARPPPPPKNHPVAKVRFAVQPWAEVSCDSHSLGTTPFPEVELTVGTHECRFTNPDLGTRTRTVDVKANVPNKVTVKF